MPSSDAQDLERGLDEDLDEDFWEDLLIAIEERRVIPIVGPELLRYDGQPSFGRQVAAALAARLRLPADELPAGFDLEAVVELHLRRRGRREELYPRLKAVVRELALPPPQALHDLAAIRDFDIFVSLTFDSLLVDAIDQQRHGSAARTLHLGFAPGKSEDLPAERRHLAAPVVYALLGKLSSMPEYAIAEEDTLEFLVALQSEARRPQLLFDELQRHHLLLLGCSFPDWLARFFIRIAKSRQLSAQRAEVETVVESRIAHDSALTLFLERYSYGTRVLPRDPVTFVAELARRWQSRRGAATAPAAPGAQGVAWPAVAEGGVFVSYASEDSAAAARLSRALLEQGLDVWFDKRQLDAGDPYHQLIRRGIKTCAVFIPLVSGHTQRRLEGYFRREWRLAEDRLQGIAEEVPFILPVAIDGSGPTSPGVPRSFEAAHWSQLPEGAVDEPFVRRVVALVRAFRKRQLGIA